MAATKSAITFNMSYIPISLYKATKHNDVSFNKLHAEDHSRIRQKEYCSHCMQEVSGDDVIKGYEYETDKYIIVTNDEIEMIKTEKDKSMQVDRFTTLDSIDPVYYDTTYYAVPLAGSEKQYELLRLVMMEAQIAAVVKTVLNTKETLFTLIPRESGIVAQSMFFHDEVRAFPTYSKPSVDEAEVKLAASIIRQLKKDYDPTQYVNQFNKKLYELLALKQANEEVVAAAPENQGTVIDLVEALQKKLDEQNQQKQPKKKGRKKAGA